MKVASINTRQIPELLKIEFKTLCAKQKISMQEAIIVLIEKAVKNDHIPQSSTQT